MEPVASLLKTNVCNLIRENFDGFFVHWIADAWHAGFPTLYVDIMFGTLDKDKTLRTRIGDKLYDLLQKRVETMGEHVSHATTAFVQTSSRYTLTSVCRFVKIMIDEQLRDSELCMFFEDETDNDESVLS